MQIGQLLFFPKSDEFIDFLITNSVIYWADLYRLYLIQMNIESWLFWCIRANYDNF